jgi:selenocysteine lyase/cysteine desulfurase
VRSSPPPTAPARDTTSRSEEALLDAVRAAEYPDRAEGVYLNAAGYGLLPLRSSRAAADLTLRRNRPGGVEEREIGAVLRRAREAVGRFLRVEPAQVTLAPNTSFGVNLGASLAASGEPGTIVVSEGEFPANVYPWLALKDRGFTVDVVPADAAGRPIPERLMERLENPDVRVFALSAVQFATGYRADLEAFGRACRERDVLFVVDAIQALGAVPLHPAGLGIDLLACGGQKWLCSPWGSGFVWIDPRHRERFDPPMVSWLAMEAARDFTDVLGYRWGFVEDGQKFELASLGLQDYLGLAHTLELFEEVGMDTLRRHILRLHRPVLDWIDSRDEARAVTPLDPARRAGILSFSVPELERVADFLGSRGVHVAVREGAIRLSPHLYNTAEEMDDVVGLLDQAVEG